MGTGASLRLAGSIGVAVGAVTVAVLLPGPAAAAERGSHVGGGDRPGHDGGSPATVEQFPCTMGGSGIWGALDGDRHDNLAVTTDAGTLKPGGPFTVTLQWEWRDWRPGAPLALRICLDADGPGAVDGESRAPLDDLGTGPLDRSFVHPDTEPALRVLTDSGEVRPVVRVPITVTVPASAPAGGELCVRGAVTGAPDDHRTSPPFFDISRTLCRPVAQALPVPSSSQAAPTPPAAPTQTPPAPPAPTPAVTSPQVMKQVTGKGEIPTTGSPVGRELVLGALLVGSGVTLARIGRRRSSNADGDWDHGRKG